MAEKRIVLFCAAGMSTSLLVNKMKQAAAKIGKDYDIAAYSLNEEEKEAPTADVILLGPQVRYALAKLKAKYPGKPVEGIDMRMYGMMDGEGTIEFARKLMND